MNQSEYEDVKITCVEDCGNSPKMSLLKAFHIAFARNDSDFILDNITDSISWDIIGQKRILGKENFLTELQQIAQINMTELHISNIITHGKTGSANGMFRLKNNKSYAFCDIYTFSSASKKAKIKEITSYVIEVD
ncbi:MAG: nuclear transport factor 2 family protein [Bacillus sp. (in: firmicutes)]